MILIGHSKLKVNIVIGVFQGFVYNVCFSLLITRILVNSSKFLQLQLPDDYDSTVCYHTKCYKYFTAVPKQPSTNSENQGLKQRLLLQAHQVCTNLNVISAIKLQNLLVKRNVNILVVLR